MEQSPTTVVIGEELCCSHLASLFDDEASADLTIIGGSEGTKNSKVRAQSHLLSSASPVFKKMLEGDWKETGGVVELKELDWDVVLALISLIYTRPVDLREDLLVDLYRAAHMYDVPVALKAVVGCVPHLQSRECVVNLAITANSLGQDCENEMASACGSYLIKCLGEVENIGRIPYKTMLAVVKAEGTDLNELTILSNLLKWSREHKEDVTLEKRRELFSHIRYGQVPFEDILEAVSEGGFACREKLISRIGMFHSSCDPADIVANLPLFTPRLRAPGSPSFKEFFPIAAKTSTDCPTVSHCNDKGWDFGIVESLYIVCKDKCTFSITGGDLGERYCKYLNMKISAISAQKCTVYLSVKISNDTYRPVRKVLINVQSDHFMFSLCKENGDRYNYDLYIQDFRRNLEFPRVFKIVYENEQFSGTNQGNHCGDHVIQYGRVFDTTS